MRVFHDNDQDKRDFLRMLDERVLVFFRSDLARVPNAWRRKAWEMIGEGQSEHFVKIALQYLETGFNDRKVVESLKSAREHGYQTLAKDRRGQEGPSGKSYGGALADAIDYRGQNRHTRAVFNLTTWNLKRKRKQPREAWADLDREFREMLARHNEPAFIDRWDPEAA